MDIWKFCKIWMNVIMFICGLIVTVGPFLLSMVLLYVFVDFYWLLLNLYYVIFLPIIPFMWKAIKNVIGEEF